MRFSLGLAVLLSIGASGMGQRALADGSCESDQCPILADASSAFEDPAKFVGEVPLPPARSQSQIVVRQKSNARVVLASARTAPAATVGTALPTREITRPTSFWLTIGTGF